jgi:ketosteroid isomerase-like protein
MIVLLLSLVVAAGSSSPEAQISAVLDDWHAAAAAADEGRYFGHFALGAVFLGTDGTERWTVDEFRRYAHPYFAKGKAWSFRAVQRHVAFSPDGNVAWFDEDLQTPNLGPSRGSGVLVKTPEGWKITQYNLSVPIPNALMKEVKERIERFSREPQKP